MVAVAVPTRDLPTRTFTRDELTQLWQRAKERASIERTRAWKSCGTMWVASSQRDADDRSATRYLVLETGPRPFDTFCPCRAGEFGSPCKHRAGIAVARMNGWKQIIMSRQPSQEAAHCIGCGRWMAVHTERQLTCESCSN